MATKNDTPQVPQQRAKRNEVSGTLLEYLDKHIGNTLYRADIAKETGLSEDQVKQGMYGLYYKDTAGARTQERLQIVVAGRSWIWKGSTAPVQKKSEPQAIYEEVFTTEKGTIIVQGEDKSLYALKPLDV